MVMGWLWEFARDGPERPANPKTFPALASTSTTSTSPRYRLSLLILRVGKQALPINP
jgi:hypothetical protein